MRLAKRGGSLARMKTKAAVLRQMELPRPYAESRPLSIEEVELDGPGENEVLVQVAGAGLCHSDLSVINGSRPRPVPMVMGHEAAGIVRDVGSGVKGLQPDDHVVQHRASAGAHFEASHPLVLLQVKRDDKVAVNVRAIRGHGERLGHGHNEIRLT